MLRQGALGAQADLFRQTAKLWSQLPTLDIFY